MIWIYLLSAVFGGLFVVPMMMGGLDLDTDFDIDLDAEADFDLDAGGAEIDVDGGLDMDADSFLGQFGDFAGSLLSFRSIIMFITFFGVSGLVFSGLGFGTIATALTASGLGFAAAMLNSALFTFIRGNEVNSQITNIDLQGTLARVIIPIDSDHKGRIVAEINQQPHYLVASPSALDRGQSFAVGDSVVVVDMERGTALVTKLDLELNEGNKL